MLAPSAVISPSRRDRLYLQGQWKSGWQIGVQIGDAVAVVAWQAMAERSSHALLSHRGDAGPAAGDLFGSHEWRLDLQRRQPLTIEVGRRRLRVHAASEPSSRQVRTQLIEVVAHQCVGLRPLHA